MTISFNKNILTFEKTQRIFHSTIMIEYELLNVLENNVLLKTILKALQSHYSQPIKLSDMFCVTEILLKE